jgi:hypothetical protein
MSDEQSKWQEYERRKAALVRLNLPPRQYELAIAKLVEELGL